MVAPIDAKASFEVEGETVTLRLNFRAISLAEEHGVDLMGEGLQEMTTAKAVTIVKCLGAQDHPEWTEDHWLAIVVKAPQQMQSALVALFTKYGGKSEGNAKGRKSKKS